VELFQIKNESLKRKFLEIHFHQILAVGISLFYFCNFSIKFIQNFFSRKILCPAIYTQIEAEKEGEGRVCMWLSEKVCEWVREREREREWEWDSHFHRSIQSKIGLTAVFHRGVKLKAKNFKNYSEWMKYEMNTLKYVLWMLLWRSLRMLLTHKNTYKRLQTLLSLSKRLTGRNPRRSKLRGPTSVLSAQIFNNPVDQSWLALS